jgi:hypothetical protein
MKGRRTPKWTRRVVGDRGAGAGITVEQHHQPGTNVAAEPSGQFASAAVDPGPDRRRGVVVQQLQLGEDFSDPPPGRAVAVLFPGIDGMAQAVMAAGR